MPGLATPADLTKDFGRLVRRVERLERKRNDVGTPTIESCTCVEHWARGNGAQTGRTGNGALNTLQFNTSTDQRGTAVDSPTGGSFEIHESGLYAFIVNMHFDSATTLTMCYIRLNNSTTAQNVMDIRSPGVSAALTEDTIVNLACTVPLDAGASIEVFGAARATSWDYTIFAQCSQVHRFPVTG